MNENIFYYNEKKSMDAYLCVNTFSRYLNKKLSNGNSVKGQLFINFRRFAILLLIMAVYWHPVLKAQTNINSFKFLYQTNVSSSSRVSFQPKVVRLREVRQTLRGDAPQVQSISSRTDFLLLSPDKNILRNNFLFDRNFKGIDITENNMQLVKIPGRVFLFTNLQHQFNWMLKMSFIHEKLDKKDSQPDPSSDKDKSFFSSNLFYFVGAAVLAVTVYLLWPKKESPANSNTTFGVPPLPH